MADQYAAYQTGGGAPAGSPGYPGYDQQQGAQVAATVTVEVILRPLLLQPWEVTALLRLVLEVLMGHRGGHGGYDG